MVCVALAAVHARADKKLDDAIAKADKQILASPDEAEKTLQKLLPQGGAEAYLALAALQLRLGKEDEAGRTLDTAATTLAAATPALKSQVHAARAEHSLIAGAHQEALARAKLAVEAEPSARALAAAARAQARAENADALATADKAVAADLKSSVAQVAKGEALLAEHKWTLAETAFRDALRLNARSSSAESGLALALSEQGKHADAIVEAKKATELDPHSADTFAVLAQVLIKQDPQKNWSAAVSAAQNGVFENPKSARAQVTAGRILALSGNYAEAEKAFGEALKADPALSSAQFEKLKLAARRDPRGAAGEACPLAKRLVGNSDAQLLCANALLLAGDYAGAVPFLEKATVLAPALVDAWRSLAWAHFYTGHADQAVVPCTKAIGLAPKNVELLTSCGLIVAKGGAQPDGIKFLTTATDLEPKNAGPWMNLGWVYRSMQPVKATESIGAYRKALELEPQNAQAALGIGWAYVYGKRWQDAEDAFTKAIAIDPKVAGDAYFGIARTWYFREDMAKARESADKAAAAGRNLGGLLQDIRNYNLAAANAAARAQVLADAAAAAAAAANEEGDSLPPLVQQLKAGTVSQKLHACHELAKFGTQAAPHLGAVLQNEAEITVLQACVASLCDMGAKAASAVPAMEYFIANPRPVIPNATNVEIKREQDEGDLRTKMKGCLRKIKG
jgi:tetratricopeptide (TPR) repeat protein